MEEPYAVPRRKKPEQAAGESSGSNRESSSSAGNTAQTLSGSEENGAGIDGVGSAASGTGSKPGAALSQEERTAILDERLQESLRELDGLLMDEERRLAAEAAAGSAGSSGGTSGAIRSSTGGVGGVINTLIGTLIVAVIRTSMLYLEIDATQQQMVFGIVLIIAIALTIDRSKMRIVK